MGRYTVVWSCNSVVCTVGPITTAAPATTSTSILGESTSQFPQPGRNTSSTLTGRPSSNTRVASDTDTKFQ